MSLGGLERYVGYVGRRRNSSFRSQSLLILSVKPALLSLFPLSSVELEPDLLDEARAGVAAYSCSELAECDADGGSSCDNLSLRR